ncbi:MAG: IclR family transcriptional regulator [Gemmobacter sp.]
MRTVEKALRLMDHFDDQTPERGLSDLARRAGLDKATTLRMLTDLAATGLVEQDPASRAWRLGAGVLRLARLREAAFPVAAVIQPILDRLAAETGETAHASLRAGRDLATVGTADSPRAARVTIEPGLILPLHATASGLAYLAFARPEVQAEVQARPLAAHTPATPVTAAALAARLDRTRAEGYGMADQTYEAEVIGLARPIFGPDGYATGAIAVASPASRFDAALKARILAALGPAACAASTGLGGRPPAHLTFAA